MGTLQHVQHQISALNDLIKINNDRITGYQKAIEGADDASLKGVFEGYADQSRGYVNQLNDYMCTCLAASRPTAPPYRASFTTPGWM
jgi:hypothetical protein